MILRCVQAPRAKKSVRVAPSNSSPSICLDGENSATLMQRARDSYLATKSCITRSVFMGMLKMADDKPGSFPLISIIKCPEIDSDGTIFAARDVPAICSAIFNAWMLLNKQPACVEKQMVSVLKFLRQQSKDKMLPMMMAADDMAWPEKTCSKAWENFKICLQDAEIIPVDLMAIRMRRDGREVPDSLLDLCSSRKNGNKMLLDWNECRHWFVPHMLKYVHDGTYMKARAAVQRFHGWGVVDYTPQLPKNISLQAFGVSCLDDEHKNNNVDNDEFVVASLLQKTDKSKNQLLLTPEERKVKAKAGPFHALVVDAARKAIEIVIA